MKAKLTLNKLRQTKNELTLRFTFTETTEFKIFMIIYSVCMIIFYITIMMDSDRLIPLKITLLSVGVISFILARNPFYSAKKVGSAVLTENEIHLHPQKDDKQFPVSPISLEQITKVVISTVSSIHWWSSFYLLHVEIFDHDNSSAFGITIKNRKQEKQYLAVLDSWYRNGFPIVEYGIKGYRVFKLEQGTSYADIQKIKKENGINW
jgi:hypothetical protein